MEILTKPKAKAFAIGLVLIFVGLAIVGGIKNYSPVPFWDMWDGGVRFFTQISNGNWAAWWAQHNEHRIVLSRILFWFDFSWLNGQNWFLIFVNYLLVALTSALFLTILKEQANSADHPISVILLGAFLCAWLFSWIQNENLKWAFQSQFFLAQLLPLTAFYCMHRGSAGEYNCDRHGNYWFVLACVMGVASLGTMANGVIALPLMVVLSAMLRFRWWKTIMLAVLAIVGNVLYFHGYAFGAGDNSLRHILSSNSLGLAAYILLYIGGPFYYFFKGSNTAIHIAQLMGIFMIVSCCCFFWISHKYSKRSDSLSLALLMFILYIGGTALGTATGRLQYGINQASSSRYMTPSLMCWAALLILYAPNIINIKSKINLWGVCIFFGGLLTLMFAQQMGALRSDRGIIFDRKISALALEMRIPDESQLKKIFPVPSIVMHDSEFAIRHRLSIFRKDYIYNGSRLIGKPENFSDFSICRGDLNDVQNISNGSQFVRIRGWIYRSKRTPAPDAVRIRDVNGMIVGYALVGQLRPDVASMIAKGAAYSGFVGYLLSSQLGQNVSVVSPQLRCGFNALVPNIESKK